MLAHPVEPRFFCQILPERKQTKHHRRPKPRLHRVDPATIFSRKRAGRHIIIHQAKHYLRSNIRWIECVLEQTREENKSDADSKWEVYHNEKGLVIQR